MYNHPKVVMITLAGMAAAIFLFIKRKKDNHRKTMRQDSLDDEVGGDGNRTVRARTSNTVLPDGETYEVFLSFRGEDTRKDFTDHLYKELVNVGVRVFRDDEDLRVGEEIGPELDQAIKASKISIPIISPNYASSKWCLQELVHMLDCKKTAGQVVLPIFYRVDPSSVRHQIGTFEAAFRSHKKKYGSNSFVVQKWRSALTEVASLKGWESSKISDGHEAELVDIVVTKVSNELRKGTPDPDFIDRLVGTEARKTEILKMVEGRESRDAQAIVIHGMGGIGKTTLAKVVYDQLSTKFKYRTFLPDIRERLTDPKLRVEDLQKQLISGILGQQRSLEIQYVDEGIKIMKDRLKQKEVLIVFDDVDDSNQLEALAREHSWFKSGSILIITTRNKDVLNTWQDRRLTYELNELDPSLSFQLFCRHAFRGDDCPSMEFHDIAKDIVSTTGGLPLAIEVIGSMLLGKPKDHWECVFEKLRQIPHGDVQKRLRITYDVLTPEQKQIFLDIACLSIQERIDFAIYMWESCKLHPKVEIEELISLSLIKRGQENQVTIHDQLRDLGRAIVREEDDSVPGNRSRLWDEEEALEVMQRNQGKEKIQALNLKLSFDSTKVPKEDRNFRSEQFKDMINLRYLRLENANLVGDFKNLLSDLRWLQWDNWGFSFASQLKNFRPMKLVVLELTGSLITEQWEGWAQIELAKNLKVIKLKACNVLTSTPNFSAFPKLEILILNGCKGLKRIPPSSDNPNKTLPTIDVSECSQLEELPNEMGEMKELRHLSNSMRSLINLVSLSLEDCSSLVMLPESIGNLTKLERLSVYGCEHLQHLPDSMGLLINLVSLSLKDCSSLAMLPESIGNLTKLKIFSVYGCEHLQHLPDSMGSLINVYFLSVEDCSSLAMLPESIGNLTKLKGLYLEDCSSLAMLPESIGNLTKLEALSLKGCSSLAMLPESIGNLTKLEELSLEGCSSLAMLPESIGNLTKLEQLSLEGCSSLAMLPESIGNLTKLDDLPLDGCSSLAMLSESIGNLTKLKWLSLKGCSSLAMLPEFIGKLTKLEGLLVNEHLQHLPDSMGSLINLHFLSLKRCSSLTMLPESIGKLTKLKGLSVEGCEHLQHLPDSMGSLINLHFLSLEGCSSLAMLPESIGNLTKLEGLYLDGCSSLAMLPESIGNLTKLEELSLEGCSSLAKLPESIGNLTKLEGLSVYGCEHL